MAKRKPKLGDGAGANSGTAVLDKQVEENDPITIADVKQFIADGKSKMEDWKSIADRSWNEIERRNKLGKLYGGGDIAKKWTKLTNIWHRFGEKFTTGRTSV